MVKNYCKTEKWSFREISEAIAGISLKNSEHDDKKIVIPRFQRGKRWDQKQEDKFIDSVKNGFPVGTLLFYKTTEYLDGKPLEVYSLVDGLQRSTAIYNYISNPTKHFKAEEVNSEMLCGIFEILQFPENQKENIIELLRKIYVEFIHSLASFKNVQAYKLARTILNTIPTLNSDEKLDKLVDFLPKYIMDTTNDFETIASTIIPAVIYSGPESNLSIIFDRINSQGTPLDEYEAYAASWPSSKKIFIKNDKIISHVLAKYDSLNDDIYTVKDYDHNEIRINKKLTIFEFVFGYSKYLNDNPILAFEKNIEKDEVSKIGFELLGLCYLDSKKKIGELHRELINLDLNKLVDALNDCIKFVEALINPMIRFKGNKRKETSKPIYSQNQILSMIAFVFREKYDKSNFNVLNTWNINEDKIKTRLPYHFVFDMIYGFWDQGGQKPYSVLSSKHYYEEISPSLWESCLNTMFENEFKRKESELKKVSNPSNSDIIFLNCIYKNKFSAEDQLSMEKFDIEHIVTKDILKKLISKTDKSEGLPISCISNLCYLPEYTNRSKKSNTFYSDKSYLEKSLITLEEIEEKYSFTDEEDLEWIDMPYETNDDFIVLRESYENFLKSRFLKLKNEFYVAMKIDKNRISQNQVENYNELRKHMNNEPKIGKYDFMIPSLNKKFCSNFVVNKGVAYDNMGNAIVLAYSKSYRQGSRNKYWFAFRPDKWDNIDASNKYLAYACTQDKKIFIITLDEMFKKIDSLNITDGEKPYYHIVLFIDENNEITWLLSKPNIEEINISSKCISE